MKVFGTMRNDEQALTFTLPVALVDSLPRIAAVPLLSCGTSCWRESNAPVSSRRPGPI